ncbi:MAG: hypothetical protein JXA90_13245, partial [Planctomycetes bacterium]|nr:hypothetical protein [Planctomycetota bacterium]
ARASAEAWPRAGAPSLEAAPREERRPQDIGVSSGLVSSWGISSLRPPPSGDRRVRFEIHADIVLYGRAEPGSQWWIDGHLVTAREDGTFELRFSLPARDPACGPDVQGERP